MITILYEDIPRNTDKALLRPDGPHSDHGEDKVFLHLAQVHTLTQVLIPVNITATTVNPVKLYIHTQYYQFMGMFLALARSACYLGFPTNFMFPQIF